MSRTVRIFKRMVRSRAARVVVLCCRLAILPPVLAIAVAAMALAQLQSIALALQVSGIHESPLTIGRLLAVVLCAVAVTLMLRQCEVQWTKAAQLDYASFRRTGWNWERTVIVVFSLLCAVPVVAADSAALAAGVLRPWTMALALGTALWSAVIISVVWSAITWLNGPGGSDLFGSLVPVNPLMPQLGARATAPTG